MSDGVLFLGVMIVVGGIIAWFWGKHPHRFMVRAHRTIGALFIIGGLIGVPKAIREFSSPPSGQSRWLGVDVIFFLVCAGALLIAFAERLSPWPWAGEKSRDDKQQPRP